jgi:CubicO group peptidase (beta-lactamase class C family)
MKQSILSLIILAQLLALMGCSVNKKLRRPDMPQAKTRLKKLAGNSISTGELGAFIEQIMEKADVPGLSIAILNDSQIVYQKVFGYRNKDEGTRNDEQTLFSAASLSKPVFAYLVMLLAEEKVIDLDKTLYEYLDKPLYEYPAYSDLKGDDRYRKITARMALSHTTGFPNVRIIEPDGRLKFIFSPGERHSYSGEGIELLQMVIEEMTGKDLETLAQEKIFQPLGMTRTSYIWKPEFETNSAFPHDVYGRQLGWKIQESRPDAGGSMVTTASDYARFLSGILNAKGQRKATVDEMLQPQVAIRYKRMFGPDAWSMTDEFQTIHLSWSLGWGRFDTPYGRAFFHTGHGIGYQNYTVTYIDKGIGIVMLSNSDNFESIAEEIAQKAIGDIYSPYDWLGYVPFGPTAEKKAPPPDPVPIQVDPAILATYAGTYDMQPMAILHVKFEENQLFLLSQDGQRWDLLLAETETSFFVQGQEDSRFIFVRDDTGSVSALQLVFHGIPMPLMHKASEQPSLQPTGSADECIARFESGLVHMDAKGQPQWGTSSTLAERMGYYQVPGVSIAVIEDNQIDWIKSYGMRVAGKGDLVTNQTLFHVGSVAKSISAAATLTLVEQGLLNLDEDVNNYLKSWKIPDSEFTKEEKVTLRRLLSHSAGLKDGLTNRGPDDPMPAYVTFGDDIPGVTLQQLLDGMPEDDIEATRVGTVPGTSYHYANADYAILELLVEDRLDQPFEDFMQIAILDRLGMAHSSYHQPLPQGLHLLSASEHTLDGKLVKGGRANFPFHAAGSLWTTPGDLSVFMIDLMKAYQGEMGHLLSPQMAHQMLASQIEILNNPLSDSYGLGVELKNTSQGPMALHTGGTWGSCSVVWFYPQLGKGAVVMINSASGNLLLFEILLSIASTYGWPIN